MKTNRRFLQLLLGLSLAACAPTGSFFAHGYYWEADPSRPSCPPDIPWNKMSFGYVQRECPTGDATRYTMSCAPAGGCYIISIHSEAEAKALDTYGISEYEHEVEWHLRKKLRHPLLP